MKPVRIIAAILAAAPLLAGCQTWQDKADTAALAECAGIADPGERKACQTEVTAAASDALGRAADRQRELEEAQEERDRLREVYGNPE